MNLLSRSQGDDLPVMVDELISAGAHPDGPGRNGLPLRVAVLKCNIHLLQQLIDHGADPNARLINDSTEIPADFQRATYNNTETVLQWAIAQSATQAKRFNLSKSLEVMLHLICAGADPSSASRFGMSCLDLARAEAASCPKTTSARLIPMAIEAPLHVAVEIQKPELCLSLLQAGHDPEIKNSRKQTAWRNAELNSPECYAAMSAWRASAVIRNIKRAATQVDP